MKHLKIRFACSQILIVRFLLDAESLINRPRISAFDGDSLEKPQTFSSKQKKNLHAKTERKKLLRQFVLGLFDPYTDDTINDEKNISHKHFVRKEIREKDFAGTFKVTATKKEIYRNKTDSQIKETSAKKLRRSKNNQAVTSKTNQDKNAHKIQSFSKNKKRRTRILKHISQRLKGKFFDSNVGNFGDNQIIPLKGDKSSPSLYKETGFPFWLAGNFASEYSPPDNFDGIYDKSHNYFLPEKNSYNEKEGIEGIWDENRNEIASNDYHRHDPKISWQKNWKMRKLSETQKKTTHNPGKKFRMTDVFNTKRKRKNNVNAPLRENIKSGHIETKSRDEKMADEFRKKHRLLEKLHKRIKVENINGNKCYKNCSVAEVSKVDKNQRSKSKQHNTKKGQSLLHEILNIPVSSILDFFHKYILGHADPGKMALKDVLHIPNGVLIEHSKHRAKNETNIDQNTSQINKKQSKTPTTRILNAAERKEVNALTRTVSSKKQKNTLKGNDSFIEFIDVLIDDRLMDKNRYSSGAFYKKSLLPKREDLNNSSKKIAKLRKNPYFIPLASNAQIRANWKKMDKYLIDNNSNVKRSDIYFPGQYPASKNDVRSSFSSSNVQNAKPFLQSFKISSFGDMQHNNKLKKIYQHPYFSNDIPSRFQYPWNNVGKKYIPSRQSANPEWNEDTEHNYFNPRKNTQEQYYQNFFTLQEIAHKPPPFTFHIYQGPHGDRMKITEQGTRHRIKNRGN